MSKHYFGNIIWMLLYFVTLNTERGFTSEVSVTEKNNSVRPNIIFLVVDDLGFSDIGCYGGEIQTPNLDRLAENGIKFTQFYNTTRCWSTRSALMSGYYPQQIGMDPYKPGDKLPAWSPLLPHYLKTAGYRCYHSGKWHVSGAPKVVAEGGFDHSYLLLDHNRNFNPQNHQLDDKPIAKAQPNSGYYTTTTITNYTLQYLNEHAEKFANQPFFVYTAYTVPHFPLHALPEDIEKYKKRYLVGWDAIREERFAKQKTLGLVDVSELSPHEKTVGPAYHPKTEVLDTLGAGEILFPVDWSSLTQEQKEFQATKMAIYAAMVDRVDQEVGRILDKVREIGAWENTLFFFLSDNGASSEIMIRGDGHNPEAALGSAETFLCLGAWSTTCNTPYRRHKVWNHEGGIATPLIVHWPKGIKQPGILRHDVGHVVDIVPTLLNLLEIDPSQTLLQRGISLTNQKSDIPSLPGINLLPAIVTDKDDGNEKTVLRDFIYFEHEGNAALRVGSWKCLYTKTGEPQRTPPANRSVGTDGWELYDFSHGDRIEQHDLAKQEPIRLAQMVKKWRELNQSFRQQKR
jgi:arylsulfatase